MAEVVHKVAAYIIWKTGLFELTWVPPEGGARLLDWGLGDLLHRVEV